jgi:hypothetical protein
MLCCELLNVLAESISDLMQYQSIFAMHAMIIIIIQKEPDDVDKPFLYLAEQFYQIYNEKTEEQT